MTWELVVLVLGVLAFAATCYAVESKRVDAVLRDDVAVLKGRDAERSNAVAEHASRLKKVEAALRIDTPIAKPLPPMMR